MNQDIAAVVYQLRQLQEECEDLAIGGLRSVGPERIPLLRQLAEQLSQIGALHLSEQWRTLIDAINSNDKSAAAALMRVQANIKLFERILTLESATSQLENIIAHS